MAVGPSMKHVMVALLKDQQACRAQCPHPREAEQGKVLITGRNKILMLLDASPRPVSQPNTHVGCERCRTHNLIVGDLTVFLHQTVLDMTAHS